MGPEAWADQSEQFSLSFSRSPKDVGTRPKRRLCLTLKIIFVRRSLLVVVSGSNTGSCKTLQNRTTIDTKIMTLCLTYLLWFEIVSDPFVRCEPLQPDSTKMVTISPLDEIFQRSHVTADGLFMSHKRQQWILSLVLRFVTLSHWWCQFIYLGGYATWP